MAASQPGSLPRSIQEKTGIQEKSASKKKPGAVSRPGANRQFQFLEHLNCAVVVNWLLNR
jgi:hypothetical protein